MLRIAVISDTHGRLENVTRLQEQLGSVDWLLHAGDHYQDAAPIGQQLGLDRSRVIAVIGNCDAPLTEPAQELVEIAGVKILLTHGHQFGVKSRLDLLSYRAQEIGAQVAIFGHSHIPVKVEEGGVLLFNPGSPTSPHRLEDAPSCGVLKIEHGQVVGQHLFIRK